MGAGNRIRRAAIAAALVTSVALPLGGTSEAQQRERTQASWSNGHGDCDAGDNGTGFIANFNVDAEVVRDGKQLTITFVDSVNGRPIFNPVTGPVAADDTFVLKGRDNEHDEDHTFRGRIDKKAKVGTYTRLAHYSGDTTTPRCTAEWTVVVVPTKPALPRYKIDRFAFEDQDQRRKLRKVQDDIDRTVDELNAATRARRKAEETFGEKAKAREEQAKSLAEFERLRDFEISNYSSSLINHQDFGTTPLSARFKSFEADLRKRVDDRQALVDRVKVPLYKAVATELEAQRAVRKTVQRIEALEASLAELQRERHAAAGAPAIQSIQAKADGAVVFAAASVQDRIAALLEPLVQAAERTRRALDAARSAQERTEASYVRAAQEASAANDEVVKKILARGNTEVGADTVELLVDTGQGAVTGGPFGAAWGFARSALLKLAGDALEKAAVGDAEEAIRAEAAAVVEGAQGPSEDLARLKIFGQTAAEGKGALAAPVGDAVKKIGAPVKEAIAAYVAGTDGLDGVTSRVDRLAKVAHAFGDASDAARSYLKPSVWKNLLKAGNANVVTVKGVAVDVAVGVLALAAKERARAEEVLAWVNYLVLDRVAELQRLAYQEVSATYWELKRIHDELLKAQRKAVEQAEQTNRAAGSSGFEVTASVPFPDGAKVAVTTKPGLERFERLRGDLGETDLVPTRAGVLTATAQGLASRRGDPRLVTLTLSVGKPAP